MADIHQTHAHSPSLFEGVTSWVPWANQSVSDILTLNLLDAKRSSFLNLLSQWHRILFQDFIEKQVLLEYCAGWYDDLMDEESAYNLVYKRVCTSIDGSYGELLQAISSFYTGIFTAAHQGALKMDGRVPSSFPDNWLKDERFVQLKATIARLHTQFMER